MSTDTSETRTENGDAPARDAPPTPGVVPPTRVLPDLSHGGAVLDDEAFRATRGAPGRADVSRMSVVVGRSVRHGDRPGTPFGYLFPDLAENYPASHLPVEDPGAVVAALKALGSAMVEGDHNEPFDAIPPVPPAEEDADHDSTIPPIYTYWGQFVDHDLTANTDRDNDLSIVDQDLVPQTPAFVAWRLRNLRQPALNLDPLYGDGPHGTGPDAVPYVGNKLLVGPIGTQGFPGVLVPPVDDLERDLPRTADGVARIGDGRNDENLIVAQLHVAFLRFHNAVVDKLVEGGADPAADATFDEARRLVRWHYQWLVVHDFLPRLVPQEAIDAVTAAPRFAPTADGVYMPLEFSVAAFRFGHSMVRAAYDHNRNFGRPEPGGQPVAPRAAFDELFRFTGKATPPFRGAGKTLPGNWPIEWDRFVGGPTSEAPDRATRKIDTRVALPLDALLNEGNDPNTSLRVRTILKRLAVRNLMRGYKLGIPTGQSVAMSYEVPVLSAAQLVSGGNRLVKHALEDGNLLTRTPLWFYVLKEAELAGGDRLGAVGGRIVAETILGQVRHDRESFLAVRPDWDPSQTTNPAGQGTIAALGGPDVRSISDLLRFAKVL